MRVFRTILGMLLLTIGLPALLVGAGLWTTMQHRDAGGAFSATLQNVATPGYAVVVGDLDALLEADAPFVRAGDTRLRLTARTASGPAFIGIAPAGEAARYLRGVSHAGIDGVNIGTGTLPVRSTREVGTRAPATVPNQQGFWRYSDTGQLDWTPSQLRGGQWTLVVMNADAQPGIRLQTTAEVRPAWLNSAAWALLVAGTVLIIVGMMVLAWPSRRREVFFVVEPSQVPELAKRMGAPLAIGSGPAGHTGAHRPRTLADANSAGSAWPRLNPPPALPQLTWPPAQSGPDTAADGTDAPAPADVPATAAPVPTQTSAVPNSAVPESAVPTSAASAGEVAEAKAAGALDVAKALDAAAAGPLIGGRPLGGRTSRRRAGNQPVGERQVFEASAVEAWVAETAAARARDVDARVTATLEAEPEDDDDTPTGTPTGAIKPVKRTAPAPATPAAAAAASTTAGPAATGPAATAATAAGAAVATAAGSGATAGPRPGTLPDKPFEATLTKAAVSKAGLSRTTPVFLADDGPADAPGSSAGGSSVDANAGGSSAVSGSVDGSVGGSADRAADDLADRPSTPTDESPETRPGSTGEVAGVPASRAPVGERRRSRRLTEDLAAAAEAALAGRTGSIQPEAATTSSAGAETATVTQNPVEELATAPQSGAERGDAAVPVARSSSRREPAAELQAASAAGATASAGASVAGKGRRKAAEPPAESGAKAARSTRRSAQSRPQSKS